MTIRDPEMTAVMRRDVLAGRRRHTNARPSLEGHTHDAGDITGLPLGVLAYAQVTANQTGLTNATITGLTVTVDVAADRRIRVTGSGRCVHSASGSLVIGWIQQDGVDVGPWYEFAVTANNQRLRSESSVVLTPSAGSHTYRLRLVLVAGTGTVTFEAAADRPGWILVEDIGAA